MLLSRKNCLVVIIAYNPMPYILKIISDLVGFDILVVDNTEDYVCDWLVKSCLNNLNCLYWHRDNVGIACALNESAEYAISAGYSCLVSLDQDSSANSILLDKLMKVFNNIPNNHLIATLGPKHISENVTISLSEGSNDDNIFGLQSANFINLELWKKLKGFNENLFIDMVDTEYYIRAKISGYSCITCNNIHMLHQVGSEVKEIKVFGKYIRAFNHSYVRKYYQSRNFMYVYFKYHKECPEVIYFLKVILTMPLTIILFESDKVRKLIYYFRGIKDMWFKRMGKLID
jgi:rhamnosyltransferase